MGAMGEPRRYGLTLIALLAAAAAGCEEERGPGETGLPKDALLIGLSSEQWQTFCTVADDTTRRPPEDVCLLEAFSETRRVAAEGTDADVRATCQSRYATCVGDIRPPPRRGPICAAGPPLTECSANVGEAEQCLTAIHEYRRQERAKLPSCSEVTAAQARETAGTGEPDDAAALMALPACQAFGAKCPMLIR
jgi:hypothetical protein